MSSAFKLVIPMSGLGSRFLAAGYDEPKPLIKVQGKRMIEWVLEMFPGEADPLFICRKEHIETTEMRGVLMTLRPGGQIAAIDGAKLGPVDALMKAREYIPDDAAILVSYCDYFMRWDYAAFKNELQRRRPAGAVPCYTGFHPHLLPTKNLYACCTVDDAENLLKIKEKHSFEANKERARHSPGVYYYGSGAMLKKYSDQLMAREDALNGEYYASMIYNHLVQDGLKVWCPANIDYFCQWGTPEDLNEYLYWTNAINGFET